MTSTPEQGCPALDTSGNMLHAQVALVRLSFQQSLLHTYGSEHRAAVRHRPSRPVG
ncbi:hypothetical protein [Streptomyces sp. NPDC005012]|uniref:hypothetical protein n=1 Tax=unclassified Streptomyces TaxID=2593676 RepID=UPI0033A95EF1